MRRQLLTYWWRVPKKLRKYLFALLAISTFGWAKIVYHFFVK
jgi:hypothetical protein